MKISKSALDEMQTERRNRIGNQMFLLTFYVLLLDAGLYGMGIHWLEYPTNSMVIIILSMSIYLVRTIAANAYLPPKTDSKKTVASLLIAIGCSVALAAAVFSFFKNSSAPFSAQAANDHSALILFLVSVVGLLLSLIAAIIRKRNDKNDSDD